VPALSGFVASRSGRCHNRNPGRARSEPGVGLEVESAVYPFERFSEEAKRVLTLAQDEAERTHQSYIGTEHLLIGIVREGEGLGVQALANLGVEIDVLREAIANAVGPHERIKVQQIIPTSRVKTVIEIAFEEAKRMNDAFVGPEHLLLGLLVDGEGIAATVLEDLGATLPKVRHELDSLLEAQGSSSRSRAPGARSRTDPYPIRKAESLLPRQPEFGDLGLFTSEACSALALGEEEAVKSTVGYFGTEHRLAGLVRQAEGTAARVLRALGVDLPRLREGLAENRGSSPRLTVQNVLPTSASGRPSPSWRHRQPPAARLSGWTLSTCCWRSPPRTPIRQSVC